MGCLGDLFDLPSRWKSEISQPEILLSTKHFVGGISEHVLGAVFHLVRACFPAW